MMRHPLFRDIAGFIAWLALCFLAAAIGSAFPPGEWYQALDKPAWTPPDWLFAPVWTLLYSMMAVAAWRVWRRRGLAGAPLPLAVFVFQLILNALWSVFFFGLQAPGLAFAHILLLLAVIALTIMLFRREDPLSIWLLVPYALWVAYASTLNLGIWLMN